MVAKPHTRRGLALAKGAVTSASLFALAAVSSPLAFDIQVLNPIGPLTEVGDTTVNVYLTPTFPGPVWGAHFRCGTVSAQRQGEQVLVSALLDPGEPLDPSGEPCQAVATVNLGPLNPGPYQLVAHLTLPDRSTTDVASSFAIVPRGRKCNADPTLNVLSVALATKTVAEFRDALANDIDYRTQLGNIAFLEAFGDGPGLELAFPPLDDPVRVVDRLWRSGEFTAISSNSRLCFSPGPATAVGTAIEYYNTAPGHYFFTPDANEQKTIDAGAVGSTWMRTGKSFPVILLPSCPIAAEAGTHLVYRFTGEPNIGPNSHFFTASQDECGYVRDRADWHWMFEGAPFWASEPVAGTCAAGQQPLFRAFNNGVGGDPNHRYATDHTVIDTMVAQGWVDEGAAMCVPAAP